MELKGFFEGLFSFIIFSTYFLLWSAKRRQQRTQTGIDPEVLARDIRPSQRFFSRLVKVMMFFIVGLILLHMIELDQIPGFYRLTAVDSFTFDVAGLSVALLGLSLCYLAQRTMGNAWRVGIDQINNSELIIRGVFGLVRNPTYCGLGIMCLGIILIFPTFSMLTWVLLFILMFEFQVRLEEEYLLDLHKNEYQAYMSRTKRYLPFLY